MCEMSSGQLEAALRALISSEESNLGLEVTMPVMMPDGQSVTVVVAREHDEHDKCVVHDASFGAMYFSAYGGKVSKAFDDRLKQVALKYGCVYRNGRVSRSCTEDEVPVACVVVANASRSIGDQALELREAAENELKYQIVEILRVMVGDRLREHETVRGYSGRSYRIPGVVLDANLRHPTDYVLPITSRSSVLHSFGELYDLRQAHGDVVNDLVYNESLDLRPEDRRILQQAADLVPFKQMATRLARLRI